MVLLEADGRAHTGLRRLLRDLLTGKGLTPIARR